ncbi:MAG: hypothetical protein Q4F21_07900 [Lachnospiraceae bacterium]|nr:hypothetical protein [Lachnospiraceae bacterium]
MEDFKTGYAVVLLSKTGKKSYVLSYIKGSFLCSFFMAFAALAFDFILVHIVFAGGAYSPYSPSEYDSSWLLFQYDHASIANIVFMFITSIVISLMAVFCTMTALVIRNRKIVYGINVILWLVFVLKKNSVVLLFQPFSEYSLKTLLLIGTGCTACYLLSVIILYMLEVYRKDEISLA